MSTMPMDLPQGADAIHTQPDAMTYGMDAYNSLADKSSHPVETVQKLHFKRSQQLKEDMAYHIYGKHFMQGLHHEQMSIAKLHAQGINPSYHSLEISMNTHNTINPEDVMSLPQHQPNYERQSTHVLMQKTHDAIGQ